jgi:hypothetical protein
MLMSVLYPMTVREENQELFSAIPKNSPAIGIVYRALNAKVK